VKNQHVRHLSQSLPSLSQKLPRRRRQSRSPYLRRRHRPPMLRVGRRRRRISVWSERNPPKSTIGRRQITPGLRQDWPRQRRGRPRRPNSSSGASLAATLATWKGELVAHLNRFKRFPANAASSGTASVAFAINRAGAGVSARLISSSGDRALDEEAVALLHRASPPPPPPAQMGGSVISLTVPIRFDR
jgi:protein TonB